LIEFGTPMLSDDDVELRGGDDLADIVLDALEVDLRLLDPCPGRCPDVEAELSRIDGREEVPADERVQEQRGPREGKQHHDQHTRVGQPPVECALVSGGELAEGRFEGLGNPAEVGPPDRMPGYGRPAGL
jgi:hypothetical protein